MKNCNKIKFYFCKHCGKIITIIEDSGTDTICCGEPMEELKIAETEADGEKHIPVIKKKCCKVTVTVGAEPHPMTENHYIKWILLQTNLGIQKKCLKPGDSPKAVFCLLPKEDVIAAYEYCSIHKLW